MAGIAVATGAAENCTNPGTGGFTLLGPNSATRRRFRDDSRISSGVQVWYGATDGTQTEWGAGTLTVGTNGAADTLSRDAVIETTAGNTSKLNFTGNLIVYSSDTGWSHPVMDLAGVCWGGPGRGQMLRTDQSFVSQAAGFGGQSGLAPTSQAPAQIGNSISFTAMASRLNVDFLLDGALDASSYTIKSTDSLTIAARVTLRAATDGSQISFLDASADAIPGSRAKMMVAFQWGSLFVGTQYLLVFSTYLGASNNSAGRYGTSNALYRLTNF